MSIELRQFALSSALMAALGMTVAACGDDGNGGGTTDDAGDAGGDTSLDVNIDGGADTGDDTGGVCESEELVCQRTRDCEGLGLDNPRCVDGCCEAGDPSLLPCSSHLEACESDTQTTDDFFCDLDVNRCLQRCDFDSADDTQSADCPLNSYCLAELQVDDPQAFNGVCLPGDCDSNIFDDEACDGAGTCLPVGNGASFCIDAGTADVDDACGQETGDSRPASDICAPGLLCFSGTCIDPCNRRNGDDDCSDDLECVGAFDSTPRNQPGVCSSECNPYSGGECAEGEQCSPVFGRFGVNTWLCQPAADEPVAEGGECETGDCAEGLICLGQGEGNPSICAQMCDPAGEEDGAFASCPGGATPGDEIFPAFDYGTTTDYAELPEGDYPVEVRVADGDTFVAALEVTTDDGDVVSYVVAEGVDVFAIDDFGPRDELPETGLRAVHASPDAGEVDAFLLEGLGIGIGGGAASEWTEFEGSGWTFEVVENFDTPDAAAGEAVLYYWFDGALGTTGASASDVAVEGNTYVQIFHGVAGGPSVDVYSCPVILGTYADCIGLDALAEDIAPGEFVAEGALVGFEAVTDGTATVFVVVTGSSAIDFAGDEVLLSADASAFAADTAYFVAAVPDGEDLGLLLLPYEFSDSGFTAAFANTDGPEVDFIVESPTAVAEAVAYQETVGGEDSAYIGVPASWYGLALYLEGDVRWASDLFEITDGALATVFIAGTLAEETIDAFATIDDFTTPAEGNGALRVVHADSTAPAVRITAPGAPDVVCTPSAVDGFGFCQEFCEPYPRGADYGCDEESSTCIPFVATDEEPVTPQGFCDLDEGTVDAGGDCSNPGFLGGDCADFAVCLELEDGAQAQCLPLCEPFGENQCDEFDDFSTCSGIPPLVGQLNFSFCVDAQAGGIGDRCTEEGLPCAADHSICLDLGSGAVCSAVCREGFDDCAEFDSTCNVGGLNPDVVPTYMGLCR